MLKTKFLILLFRMRFRYLLISILFFFQSCGYTPIYQDLKDFDYKINIIEINGDDPIVNNLIYSKLKRVSNDNSKKIINLKISNSVEKKVLSKNKKNEITYYLILQDINFELNDPNNKNKFFKFRDQTRIENISDQFEFKKYQDTIVNNFISLKTDEFILNLSQMK